MYLEVLLLDASQLSQLVHKGEVLRVFSEPFRLLRQSLLYLQPVDFFLEVFDLLVERGDDAAVVLGSEEGRLSVLPSLGHGNQLQLILRLIGRVQPLVVHYIL